MTTYDVSVRENGIELPEEIRQLLGVANGDRLVLVSVDGEVRLSTTERRRRDAQRRFSALFPGSESVVDEFIAEKRAEVEREAAKGQP